MADGKDKRLIYKSINRFLDELKKRKIEVIGAYLFGSYAKGSADRFSDIDLVILTKKFIGDSFDFKFLLMKIAKDIDIDLEPHPYLAKDFNKDNPFAYEVMQTGKKVA